MPQVIGIIAALAGIASSTVGIVKSLKGPGTPPSQAPTPAAPSGLSEEQKKALLAPQFANIQELTGGSLSPEYFASVAPLQAGIAGTPGIEKTVRELLASFFGTSGGAGGIGGGAAGGSSFQPGGLPMNLQALARSGGTSDFLEKIAGGLAEA